MLRKARAAMLGLALGDALGATVEFMTPGEIRAGHGVHREIVGGGWLRLPRGQVTDDTTMSFALAEAWLAGPGAPEAVDCARAFDGWMRGKPVDIGNTVRRGIVHFRRTGQPHVPPSSDAGNGAAMRCLPVALATLGAPPAQVHAAALAQAHVTHNNPLSDAATIALVDMLQAALLGAGRSTLLQRGEALAAAHPDFAFRNRRCDNPSGYIVDTLRAVLQGLEIGDGFEDSLVEVVNRGGDADTTGAILGMLLGAVHGLDALPQRWLNALDGRAHARCMELAAALLQRSPRWQALAA